MTRRSRAREVALQILCEDDVNPRTSVEETKAFLKARLKSVELEAFSMDLILGVRRKLTEVDALLESTADNWTVKRMASTDRNVLRIGAFELLYSETPYRVAINEAIELAKRYGNANSAHFVNGILDKLPKRGEAT